MKKVLVIGSGAREHAITWKLVNEGDIKVFTAPGNAGTAKIATNIIAVSSKDLITFVKKEKINLTVVGPDNYLAAGIVDDFLKNNLLIFGPTREAAKIEWSKVFAKEFMSKYNIPTAKWVSFNNPADALNYAKKQIYPLVIKDSNLAFGKGVFICKNLSEAETAISKIKGELVIEEFLEGEEVSVHAVCSNLDFVLFPLVQDHKRIGEGNTGANTGGMGTICPVSGPVGEIQEIIKQTLHGLQQEGIKFTGCLFPGLMLTNKGVRVLEYNARFGDPETQVLMRLLTSSLYELLLKAAQNSLNEYSIKFSNKSAACVVLASNGYPNDYEIGKEIIIGNLSKNVEIFHAGTENKNGKLLTSGGRVLSVTAVGKNLSEALNTCYKDIENINFSGKTFRKDIGKQNSAPIGTLL